MTYAGITRPALITVSGALAAGWLLVACGDDETPDTDRTTETTTQTTAETTTETDTPSPEPPTEPAQPTETTDGQNTIEIPTPEIDIPSPELPEVTTTPVP